MTLLERVQGEAEGPGTAVGGWVDVCSVHDLLLDVGACALVAGAPVAIFRTWPNGELFAIGNIDPYTSASVISRGIVGSIGDRPVVASPIMKHRFDLHTGESLDDPAVVLPTYAVRVTDDRVLVAASPTTS